MNDFLFTRRTPAQYAGALHGAVDAVAVHLAGTERPRSAATPAELEDLVARVDLDRPLGDVAAALEETRRLYLDHAVHFHDPGYIAHLNCPVAIPAVAAEALTAAVNTAVETWDQSTTATLVEQRLVDWTTARIGFPAAGEPDGVFTTGGTQSNLQALFTAREQRLSRPHPAPRQERLGRLRIVAGEHAHFSVDRAAHLLGLPADAVVPVPAGRDGALDPVALERALHEVAVSGDEVAAVVATAGSTDLGVIDPLPAVADLCRAHEVWLHVDAAYGGGLLVSPTRRHLLEGIERADSVTVDFHKSWFQPVAASALLLARGRDLRFSTWSAEYLNPRHAVRPNLVDKSLQTTRRFDALKLWMTLRTVGAPELGRALDRVLDLAQEAGRIVADAPDMELVARPVLSTVLFRHRPQGTDDDDAERLVEPVRAALFDSGRAVVASTVVGGRRCLKFTFLNPVTTAADVERVLDLVRAAARDAAPLPAAAGAR
ncbi:pyridoxal-dependent decarboxylase [Kocuria sp. SM24M-10]|uniref:pyridoxal phosphate-dependent decarboxylase family protein n=1 Tax=Kocuria sp. SM24M-10 TaxID=1660349 RepID=UPI000649F9D0|nr:pyridoxal-dependent decarboxylase [Kocuria sp. SM24M-10]KLU11418.1 pyridoxal-dependent decarboxylase [Kocuria sp. SM24M-10]